MKGRDRQRDLIEGRDRQIKGERHGPKVAEDKERFSVAENKERLSVAEDEVRLSHFYSNC